MDYNDIISKLKFVKQAQAEVMELPDDQFRKILYDSIVKKRRELVGLLVQWTVDNAKTE